MLSDLSILEAMELRDLEISPFDEKYLQPTSVDLHLGSKLLICDAPLNIDFDHPIDLAPYYREENADGYILEPGGFVLGATFERVRLRSGRLCAFFDGRSTLGRLGLIVHVTAGYIDPGFDGNITLEIKNLSNNTYRLAGGMGIGQLLVDAVEGGVHRLYGSAGLGSKYGGTQVGARAPILRKDKL